MKQNIYIYIILCAIVLPGCQAYNYHKPPTSSDNKKFTDDNQREQHRLSDIIKNNS